MTRRGKKRLLILLSLIALLGTAAGGAYFVREARRAQRAAEAYRDGMAAYDEGRWEDSLRGLGKSLSEHRGDPEVLYRLADVRRRVPAENNRHVISAIAFAREAASLDGRDSRPLELLVALFRQVGFITERLDAADRLLALDPTSLEAHTARVECLATLGRNAEASAAVDALIAAHPGDVRGHEMKIEMMRLEGVSADEVLAYVDELAAGAPDHIGFVTMQARLNSVYGRRDEARQAAARLLSIEIPDSEALLDIVRTLDMLGMRSDADALLDRTIGNEDLHDEVLLSIIERAWKLGHEDRARTYLDQTGRDAAATPSSLLGWKILLSLPDGGEWSQSEEGRELAARGDEDAVCWETLLRARTEMVRQDHAEARKRLSEAIGIDDASSLAWNWLGEVSQRLGEPDLAVSCLEQAVIHDPTWSRSQMMLAAMQLEQGRLTEARAAAERALVLNPGAPEALTLARTYAALLDAGRGDRTIAQQAVAILEEVATMLPDEPDVIAILARIYLAADLMDEARSAVDRLVAAPRPPSSPPLLDLITACRRKAPALVDPLLDIASSIEAPGPDLLALLTERTFETDPEAVRTMYLEAAAKETDADRRIVYEIAYARALERGGDAGALAEYKRLSAAYPSSPAAQQALLDSRVAWNDPEAIAAAIVRLREATGEQATQWRLAEAQRRLAFEPTEDVAAQVVVLLAPLIQPPIQNVKALMLTSDALLRLQDRNGAITMLGRAADRQPDNALLYIQMIRLMQESGRSAEAAQRLREFANLANLAPGMRRQRIELLQRQAMWTEAIRDAEELAASTGEVGDELALARLYAQRGRNADARRLFDRLLALPEVDGSVCSAAAHFYATTESLERGLSVLDRLRDTVDADAFTVLLAAFHERLSLIDEAAAIYRNRAERSGDPDHWAALAQFHIRHRSGTEAREAVSRGLAIAPQHEILSTLRGVAEVLDTDTLDPAVMESVIDTMVAESARPAMRQIAQAIEFINANPNDPAEYIARLRKVVDGQPQLLVGWQLLVNALLSDSRPDEAVTAAQNAARILPASVRAAELVAATLAQVRRFEEARAAAARWRELEVSDRLRPDLLLAQIDRETGRPDRAYATLVPYADRLEREAEDFPGRLELFSSILVRTARHEAAHSLLWSRAQQGAEWARAYMLLAGQIDSPQDRLAWVDRIEPLVALSAATRAEIAGVRYGLGHELRQSEQFERAIALVEPVMHDPEVSIDAIMMVAEALEQVGRRDRAEAAYRLALEREPANPFALNNLAFVLLSGDTPSEEPVLLASRAVEEAKRLRFPPTIQANLLETLGSALIAVVRFAEAERAFAEGLTLTPDSTLLRLGRAHALIGLERKSEAKAELQAALANGEIDLDSVHLARRFSAVSEALAGSP